MRDYLGERRRLHGRISAEYDAEALDRAEATINRQWREWRWRQRKIAVFKAIAAWGLIFLICGSAALIAYALEW